MSYTNYTTDAFVCGHLKRGNADKLLYLFTEEGGMLMARAVSVREERSKMRFALEDFSFARVSLVRGKQGWRVVGVTESVNHYLTTDTRAVRRVMREWVLLLRRLVIGEDNARDVYVIFRDGVEALMSTSSDTQVLDMFVRLRMLHALGYIDASVIPQMYVESSYMTLAKDINKEDLSRVEDLVLSGIEASQL